jgi:hypothetical protein
MSVKLRYVGAAVGVGAIAVTLVLHRGSLLSPGDVLHALALANPWWLLLAAAAQFASLAAFSEQQRYLVKTFGGAMTLRRSIGVTFARTAISVTVPGGPAVSIAFAIRQFRARGATAGAATAVTVLAGLQGIGSLLLVYLAWFSTVGLIAGHFSGLGTAAAAAIVPCSACGWSGPGPTPAPGSGHSPPGGAGPPRSSTWRPAPSSTPPRSPSGTGPWAVRRPWRTGCSTWPA